MHSCLIIDFYEGEESGASQYAILVTSEKKMMPLFVNENGHSNYYLLIHLEYYVLHFINFLPQASNINKEK